MKASSIPSPLAVLFDFDGVFADSKTSHHQAWKQAHLEILNTPLPVFPQEKVEGCSSFEIALILATEVGQAERAQDFFDRKLEILLHNAPCPEPHEGVRALVEKLDQQQIPYGIASNAPSSFLKESVQKMGFSMDYIYGMDDVVSPKPHPEIYFKLAESLQVKAEDFERAWIIEDSLPGMKAAVDSGMFAIGVATNQSKESLLRAGAKVAIDSISELVEFVTE